MATLKKLFREEDAHFVQCIDRLCYANPFLPERLDLERHALGAQLVEEQDAWSLGPGHRNRNYAPLAKQAQAVLAQARARFTDQVAPEERRLYASLVRYALYFELSAPLEELARESLTPGFGKRRVALYRQLNAAVRERLGSDALVRESFGSAEHLFAILFQLRRAFEVIFGTIVGRSEPSQALRAAVWQSVFTHDMRRYERTLYGRMHDTNTLILGPSGTGKELVARAIGLSRYLPFDQRSLHFEDVAEDAFFALNVGALPATLVESELFGHRRGSFTGAVGDSVGWFESCPEHGTVFLDEVGELPPEIQVKLLCVLQNREFHRVGEQKVRRFAGKVVAATNQDLRARLERGEFREDFYYRLCSDVIRTPSLHEQLQSAPDDLERLVAHVSRRIVEPGEVEALVEEACVYVRQHLGLDYPWPGNVRELEQCVRNIVIRGRYEPANEHHVTRRTSANDTQLGSALHAEIARGFLAAEGNAERQVDVYVTLSYAQTGNFAETGRLLGLDRRTVKARVDHHLLQRLRAAQKS